MKSTVQRLPAEQVSLLLGITQQLKDAAWYIHYRYLNLSLGNQYSPSDVLQEAWADILTARNYPPADEKQLYLWARTVMKNRCINRMKQMLDQNVNAYGFVQGLEETPEEVATEKVKEVIARARLRLQPYLVQLLEYRAAGITDKEIAESTGVNYVTVRTRFFTAKKTLQKLRYNWQD
jgi:RNA polymerase sigma factor (sigma-70 family)